MSRPQRDRLIRLIPEPVLKAELTASRVDCQGAIPKVLCLNTQTNEVALFDRIYFSCYIYYIAALEHAIGYYRLSVRALGAEGTWYFASGTGSHREEGKMGSCHGSVVIGYEAAEFLGVEVCYTLVT